MKNLLLNTRLSELNPISEDLPTALSERLNTLYANKQLDSPVTQSQFIARARALPLLAVERDKDESGEVGFAPPKNLSTLDLRGLGLVAHGFSPRNKKILAEHISPLQHMVLIAHEATPRPLGFAMNGYSASDFIAYIYQDVAERFIHNPVMRSEEFTREKAKAIKMWLGEKVPRKQHSPQRHIRRRLMALFGRSNQQINSLFIDRESPPEMILLFRKLMERDDNLGYIKGQLRNFELVRSDLNRLAQAVTLKHYLNVGDIDRAEAFMRVDCPATISDFSALQIDKPRTRKAK